MYWNRHDRTSFNIKAICDINMLFTYVWNGAPGSCHDTVVLTLAQDNDSEFPLPPRDKYYVVDSGYPNKQGFLASYRSSRNRVFGITCHSSTMVLLLEINMSCLIDVMHLYVLLLKGKLEFGRKNGGFFMNFLDMILMSKKQW
ncbi:putative harbinger transposase-derived nuclease domain-containing protein [Arabidopsis thaliana]